MGLSERKTKQRLGADPRNLAWANDNARFGQQYLEKFGWTVGSGSGLGTSGQGRVSHISVAHKLNLLGIGGNNSNGDVSWKQNRDYELMLKRLNTSGGDDESERIGVSVVSDGFVRAVEGTVTGEKGETNVAAGEVGEEERKRLRKERKRKEKAAAKGKASVAHDGTTSCVEPSTATMGAASTISPSQPAAPAKTPRRMPHRAKFRASKQLALSDAAALSEILGVSQSMVPSSVPSQPQSALDTPADSPSPVPTPPTPALQRPAGADDQIRTSTTSVADYFAAKMRARQQQGTAAPAAGAATPSTAAAPPAETVPEQDPEAQDAPEVMTLVAGGVAGEKKEGKKRKRKDGVEKAETNRDSAERHGESKKKRKKRKAE